MQAILYILAAVPCSPLQAEGGEHQLLMFLETQKLLSYQSTVSSALSAICLIGRVLMAAATCCTTLDVCIAALASTSTLKVHAEGILVDVSAASGGVKAGADAGLEVTWHLAKAGCARRVPLTFMCFTSWCLASTAGWGRECGGGDS